MINPERAGIEDDSMIVGFVSLVIAFTRYQVPDTAPGIIYITLSARPLMQGRSGPSPEVSPEPVALRPQAPDLFRPA
jgi:hypothetical protein